MPKQEFVVLDPNNETYLSFYSFGEPPIYLFGSIENAIVFSTLAAAQAKANEIGGGTVGTTKH